jgi:hypothetical protein
VESSHQTVADSSAAVVMDDLLGDIEYIEVGESEILEDTEVATEQIDFNLNDEEEKVFMEAVMHSSSAQSDFSANSAVEVVQEEEEAVAVEEEPVAVDEELDMSVAKEEEALEGDVSYTDVEFNGSVYRGYHLSYGYDFDENGVMYFLGTNHKRNDYQNPHDSLAVVASMSSVYKGTVRSVVARTIATAPTYTDNALNSWIKVDFGPNRLLLADNYTIRHGASSRGNALRNWTLQAKSGDDVSDDDWITLREHDSDYSISDEPDSAATWELDIPDEISDSSTIGFRYFRLVQHGPNSNGNNCLFCCGLEFYGVLFEKLD